MEKELLELEVRRLEELDRIRRENVANAKKSHQDELRFQMEHKDKSKRRELQDKMYEERAAKLAEIQYKRMVEDEKKRGLQLLEELRSKRPF